MSKGFRKKACPLKSPTSEQTNNMIHFLWFIFKNVFYLENTGPNLTA